MKHLDTELLLIGDCMSLGTIESMFFKENTSELEFTGKCHDCKKEVAVLAIASPDGIIITGGAVYFPERKADAFVKCDACFSTDPVLRNFQPCSVYSRVTGYLRPIETWNDGKVSEFNLRIKYTTPTSEELTI